MPKKGANLGVYSADDMMSGVMLSKVARLEDQGDGVSSSWMCMQLERQLEHGRFATHGCTSCWRGQLREHPARDRNEVLHISAHYWLERQMQPKHSLNTCNRENYFTIIVYQN
jgi:hypothetical protein